MSSKRLRTINFSQSEKELLLELVSEYKEIIESKKTDAFFLKEKEAAWVKITVIFNSQNTVPRSVSSIKNCWDNIKRKCRKLLSAYTIEVFKTGGGKLEGPPLDDFNQKVQNMLSISLDGLHNSFECDTSYNEVEEECDLELFEAQPSTSREKLDQCSKKRTLCVPLDPDVVTGITDSSSTEAPEPQTSTIRDKLDRWSIKRPLCVRLNSNLETGITNSTSTEASNISSERRMSGNDKSNGVKKTKIDFARRRPILKKSAQELFWEEKLKLITQSFEYAEREEKRKVEIHKLEISERKLRLELLELQLLREQQMMS